MRQLSAANYDKAALASDVTLADAAGSQDIPGLGVDVQPGTYRLYGIMDVSSFSLGTRIQWGLTGPTSDLVSVHSISSTRYSGGIDSTWGNVTSLPGTLTLNDAYYNSGYFTFDGLVRVTASGTIMPHVGLANIIVNDPNANLNYDTTNCEHNYSTGGPSHSAPWAHFMTPDGSGAYAESYISIGDSTTIGSQQYEYSAWLYMVNGHPEAGLSLNYYDSGSPVSEHYQLQAIPAATWTKVTLTTTAPPLITNIYPGIWLGATIRPTTASDVVWFDDIIWKRTTVTATIKAGSLMTVTPI